MTLAAGSIAFTAFNVSMNTTSQFNFVALEALSAGTTITFTDNNWNGSSFTTNEATWTWTATSDIAAGTIVTLNDLIPGSWGAMVNPASNLGTVTYSGTQPVQQYQFAGETLYAYTGDASNPTFLTAFATNNLTGSDLTNTGLIEGVNAISLNNTVEGFYYPVISVYDGPTSGFSSFADYLAALHQPDNWTGQRNFPDAGDDDIHPDLPLPSDPFVVDPTVQTIGFAPDSVHVTVIEGQDGESSLFTFTVVRSGSTEGAIDFTGSLVPGVGIDAADFGGTLPNFSGTIADGQTAAVVTILVSGDIRYESNEKFDIVLQGGSNPGHSVVVGGSDTAHATITNTDQPQIIGFAQASQSFQVTEGNSGEVTLTFTVERTGGTLGDTTFTIVAPAGGSSANGDDFDGVFPFTGIILDGQSAATFTLTINGDVRAELTEQLRLQITSVGNEVVGAVIGSGNAYVTITNDDPAFSGNVIGAGEIVETPLTVAGGGQFTVEAGGKLDVPDNQVALQWSGANTHLVVENAGLIKADGTAISSTSDASGSLIINNLEGGKIEGTVSTGRLFAGSSVTLNNAGTIEARNAVVNFAGAADNGASVYINNLEGGVMRQTEGGASVMLYLDTKRLGGAIVVNNSGLIMMEEGHVGGGDVMDFDEKLDGVVNNYATGHIEGSRHAVTGERAITVYNEGTMIGRNGSAVNMDTSGTEVVTVTNRGRMEGRSADLADSDGDAIDVDSLLTLDNYGFVGGMGHEGYHNGEPNVSEGVAIGGGTIRNHAGGEIYGYGRAIQVDNSSNGNAWAATTIVNAGLIRGDGNQPEGVDPDDLAGFDLRGNEAINLINDLNDSLTNTGTIIGGVSMGRGDDLIINKGTMTATGGSAVNLGEGNDTFEAHAGSTVTGLIDGGEGDDTLKLVGPGVGTLGANANFETLEVQSGIWTLQSDAYDQINVAAGAMVMSQLKLADQGEMHVAAGGSVLVANGSDAVVAEGAASVENAGLIQALGMNGGTPARAILTNGGEITNKAGGVILAQGVAIASGAAAVAGVDVVNEGMIQSLSGQAIALSGDQDDSVTNKGLITGSVDLGAGDDTLTLYVGSSISGAMEGGDGEDTVNLTGIGTGTLGTTSGFEAVVVKGGTWSIANTASYDHILIEDGATVTTLPSDPTYRTIARDGADTLAIEEGGKGIGTVVIRNDQTSVGLDNAGTIDKQDYGQALNLYMGEEDFTVTIWNRATGQIKSTGADGTGSGGVIYVSGDDDAKLVFNNAGLIEGPARAFQANDFRGASFVLNNLAGGVIRSDGEGETLRGKITQVNNAGRIEGGSEGFDFRSNTGVTFNNLEGGYIEGLHHAVTGGRGAIVTNAEGGMMVGLNGSAVNIDNNASEANKAFITNRGLMEGRSAETSDSDGDAIDVDGLAQILNYGRIAGLGAEGYHNGEPNVSEGIAMGGGTVVNNATGEIYGYGRGIQVDNSSNSNALGATTIVNDGLIQGDGHGPEGVDPEDAAEFDLRGNEAINLVGDHEDFIGNNSTGRIIGGISMGGGRDTLNNSGLIRATGGSAIDMGAGNDQLNLYVGSVVEGTILLGDGDDVANSTSAAAYVIYGGAGNDSIAMYYTIFGGDDVLYGETGNDTISGGLGNDRIDGGLDNDTLYGEDGSDTFVAGNPLTDGADKYDGGAGVDTIDFSASNTAINLTLAEGTTTFGSDSIVNVENVVGSSLADRLFGNSLANELRGGDGADRIEGLGGDDRLFGGLGLDVMRGGDGDDYLEGGEGTDQMDGGAGNDTLKGGADNDAITGADGNDLLDGGDGNDTLNAGAGDDEVIGGAGNDKVRGNEGNDKLDGGAGSDALEGGDGNDQLNAGEGDDYLDGGIGNDRMFGGVGVDTLLGGEGNDLLVGGAGNDKLTGGAGADQFGFNTLGDGIDTITDFTVTGSAQDQIVLAAGMFQGFGGSDAFGLIGGGFLRTQVSGGQTQIQIDVDGGGNNFQTLAIVNGNFSNGMLADHVLIQLDPII